MLFLDCTRDFCLGLKQYCLPPEATLSFGTVFTVARCHHNSFLVLCCSFGLLMGPWDYKAGRKQGMSPHGLYTDILWGGEDQSLNIKHSDHGENAFLPPHWKHPSHWVSQLLASPWHLETGTGRGQYLYSLPFCCQQG